MLAAAPRHGLCKRGLEAALGREGCARLQAVLVARAARWAVEAGDPYVAFVPEDARDEVAALAPGCTLLPQGPGGTIGERRAAVVREVLGSHPGPLLLAGVDAPRLAAAHATAAVDDLRDGIDVTVGPSADGGYYLIGMRAPHDALFALPDEAWDGPEMMMRTLEACAREGLSVGMLRAERDLDDEGDARALLADPLAPGDVRECLTALLG